MKIICIILFVLGGLLIAFNILAFLVNTPNPKAPEIEVKIGYYIGYSVGFILGGILILIGYLIGKKDRRKKERLKAKQSIETLLK